MYFIKSDAQLLRWQYNNEIFIILT